MRKSKFANYRPLDNEYNPNFKLLNLQVDGIRDLYKLHKYSLRELGRMFNVSHRQILRIARYTTRLRKQN
jgi:hypothetical protein